MTYPQFYLFVDELKKKYQGFKIINKGDSKLMKFLYYATLMPLWNKGFMTDMTSVVGTKVYMPEDLMGTYYGYKTLRHEKIHIDRIQQMGILYYINYFFVLPAVWTLRAEYEFEAYVESIRVDFENGVANTDNLIEWYVNLFASSKYLWMCPFKSKMRKRFRDARNKIYNNTTGLFV